MVKARPSLLGRILGVLADEVLVFRGRLVLVDMVEHFLPHFCFNRLRTWLYRACGVEIGARSIVLGRMELTGSGPIWKKLRIGTDCQITAPLYVDLNAEITIGNEVALAHHVVLVTSTHDIGTGTRRCGTLRSAPIVIEDGCWIGAGVTILPGVTIGRCSVIAAGAVVASDIPANTLAGGVPAKPIRSLPPVEEK
jgi:acetyltransferase-like isoleucine patch superfamily enzyme